MLTLKPKDKFTGFLSLDDEKAIKLLKAACVEAVLCKKSHAEVMKRLPVQLYIRRAIQLNKVDIMQALLDLGYQPPSEEELWLIIEQPNIADLVAFARPELALILQAGLDRNHLVDRTKLREFISNRAQLSPPNAFTRKMDAALATRMKAMFHQIFS